MMNTIFLVILAIVLALLVAWIVRQARGGGRREWPLYAKKPLSVPEQVLFHRLVKSLPECIILAQVQVSRVLGVKKGYNFHQWNNRINRLSLDFVVCKKDSSVIAAIELDDSSHQLPRRKEADQRKERALEAAGVPLHRWSVKALPDEGTIRAVLTSVPQPDMAVGDMRREPRLFNDPAAVRRATPR